SKQQLIVEHELIENYSDKANYDVRRRESPDDSILKNFQLDLKVSITDLQVNNKLLGKFLLCRVIIKRLNVNAILTLVEDPEGNVERLALYHWILDVTKNDESDLSIHRFLPIGTKLIIKDPFYKIAGDGYPMICSCEAENVIIINDDNNLFD